MAEYDDYITIDNAVNCASAVLGLSDTQKSAVQRYMRTIPAVRTPKYDPDEFFGRKRQTNADRIRKMSDEELANIITDDWCEILNCKSPCDGHCDLKVLAWLQQEVDT